MSADHPALPVERSRRPSRSVWWLVFRGEIEELWVAGKALNLLILFTCLMSLTAFLLATNSELSLTPPRLMIVTTIQAAITFGLFIGLVLASESVSGERERATLEPLLLAPASRRQIIAGKYLASLSPWPIAYLITIPYVAVLSQGDIALSTALVWGAITGTIVVITFTGLGMLASMLSNSSRTSLFVSLVIYLIALLPSQLPGEFQRTPLGTMLRLVNPLEAARQFMIQGFIEVKPVSELWPLLYAPIVATLVVIAIIFFVAVPRLGLEAGAADGRSIWQRGTGDAS